MANYSESDLLRGIQQDDSDVFNFIYREYYPYVESYVHQHGGSTAQAEDVFQDTMIVLFKRVRSGNLTLVCKLSTYIYAVAKRIWIQENRKLSLRRSKIYEEMNASEPSAHYGDENPSDIMEILESYLNNMSPACRQIIKLFLLDLKNDEIRQIMNFDSIAQVVDKKYRCKKQLVQRIRNDPSYTKLKHGKGK